MRYHEWELREPSTCAWRWVCRGCGRKVNSGVRPIDVDGKLYTTAWFHDDNDVMQPGAPRVCEKVPADCTTDQPRDSK